MKSPIDVVKGRITGYDPRTQELTIVARYPDWPMMLKREYSECNIQLIDGRPLSGQQRKTCYALLRAISDFTGMGLDPTKEYMKIKFLTEDLEQTADQIFSLSNAPMSLVCAFQRFLVHFILDWDIPCNIPLLEFVDDTQDYIYACLVTKKCCICGLPADLHHEDAVGAGRDRTEIIHEGMEALPLCRCHHTEKHIIVEIANELSWLAYRLDSMRRHQATAEGLKTTSILREAAAILLTRPDAEPNDPLTLEELRAMYYNEEGPVWVNAGAVFVPAVLDIYDGVLVAVWSALGIDTALLEQDYGKTWVAYRRRPEEKK